MNEEAVLFNTFNALMQTRTKPDENGLAPEQSLKRAGSFRGLSNKIMGDLGSLEELLKQEMHQRREANSLLRIAGQTTDEKDQVDQRRQKIFQSAEGLCKIYREYTLDREIPDDSDIKKLRTLTGREKVEHFINLLEKFGRFCVLDIAREVTLLRQIKDIQDELEMMEKVFAEQKEALESMDRIIRTMNQHGLDPSDDAQTIASTHRPAHRRASHGRIMERDHNAHHRSLLIDIMDDDTDSDGEGMLGHEYSLSAGSGDGVPGTERRGSNNLLSKLSRSMIWGDLRERQNLPLRTITRHSKQIKRMNERAKNTNSAVRQPYTFVNVFGGGCCVAIRDG